MKELQKKQPQQRKIISSQTDVLGGRDGEQDEFILSANSSDENFLADDDEELSGEGMSISGCRALDNDEERNLAKKKANACMRQTERDSRECQQIKSSALV